LNAYNVSHSSIVSNKPSASWIAWLHKSGYLSRLYTELNRNLYRLQYGDQDDECVSSRYDDELDDISRAILTYGYREVLQKEAAEEAEREDYFYYIKDESDPVVPVYGECILDNNEGESIEFEALQGEFDVEKFANLLSFIVSKELDYSDQQDPEPIAEMLLYYGDFIQKIFTRNLKQIFVHNWKYSRFMHRSGATIGLMAFLINPCFKPLDLEYEDLTGAIVGILEANEVQPIGMMDLKGRLFKYDIDISFSYLYAVVLNEERLLLLHTDYGAKVVLVDEYMKGWRIAADLFKSNEYVTLTGFGYDSVKYDRVSVKPNYHELRRFFTFHNADIDWDVVDLVELSLKLRSYQSQNKQTIQGIPSHVYRYIVDWIKDNGKIWMTRNSRRILGKEYYFKVEDVAPGQLLAYGDARQLHMRDRTALVLRDMVSEANQTRRMIHPSRVLTPFKEAGIYIDKHEMESMIQLDKAFEEMGVVSVEYIAMQILRKLRVEPKPYNVKRAKVLVYDGLPHNLENIGKDLLVRIDIYEEVTSYPTYKEKRKAVLDSIVPRGMSVEEYAELLGPHEMHIIAELVG